ncbi:MAG: GH3 auxin-responsive promoter family protein [Alistipes sp.]
MSIRNSVLQTYFARRGRTIDLFRRHPLEVQREMLKQRLAEGVRTSFGQEFGLQADLTPEAFARALPTFDYDSFKPYIERMFQAEKNVVTLGEVKWFARSSGTTSDRSKYIPVTTASLLHNHTQGMRDVASTYVLNYPQSTVCDGKVLTLGGSYQQERGRFVGDLSAVAIKNTPFWSGWFRAPKMATALIPDFDAKAEAICRECVGQPITAIAGVPSWNLALMRRILAYTGCKNLLEVWPNLELFAHGGVSFRPYLRAFEELIPSPKMHYVETYNASEGFFALADDPMRDDMLLMLDYGTYFEFRQQETIVPLEGVKAGETYVLLVTSNNGLWRYEIGDTITFTSTDPYRIRFSGRTRQYINVFGEELIADNVEQALACACEASGAEIEEYTVAPCYMNLTERGAHEWVVEFRREPDGLAHFTEVLDHELRALNSDYDAKRLSTLDPPRITVMAHNHFLAWLKSVGKTKIPRLMNDRSVADRIIGYTND